MYPEEGVGLGVRVGVGGVVGLEHAGGCDSDKLSYVMGCMGEACDVDGIGWLSAEDENGWG